LEKSWLINSQDRKKKRTKAKGMPMGKQKRKRSTKSADEGQITLVKHDKRKHR